MAAVGYAFVCTLSALFRSRVSLQVEIVALRHQLAVYQGRVRRPHLCPADRILWAWLSRNWATWRDALVFVQPATVIAWQRKRFRDHWTRLSRAGKPGRPAINAELRELIRKISGANQLWGTPRIVGELAKLGIKVAKSTVDKYRVRSRKTPSPTWKAFLTNHINDIVSIDFLIVPTIRFKLLFVLVVLAHSRRKVLHFNVTDNPTAQWTAQQIVEAFPWDSAPKYLLRDRDAIYSEAFQKRVHGMAIEQVVSAPRSPWQNPFVERLIGTLGRGCLDHVIVLNEHGKSNTARARWIETRDEKAEASFRGIGCKKLELSGRPRSSATGPSRCVRTPKPIKAWSTGMSITTKPLRICSVQAH